MKKIILITTALIISLNVSFAQDDEAYEKALKKMFEVSNTDATFKMVIDQMLIMMKSQYSNVPAEAWDELKKEMQGSLDDLVTMLIPIYKQHLTLEDLQGIIDFYETPVGKKYAEKTPAISAASMQVGQQWGMQIAQKITKKLEEKGY